MKRRKRPIKSIYMTPILRLAERIVIAAIVSVIIKIALMLEPFKIPDYKSVIFRNSEEATSTPRPITNPQYTNHYKPRTIEIPPQTTTNHSFTNQHIESAKREIEWTNGGNERKDLTKQPYFIKPDHCRPFEYDRKTFETCVEQYEQTRALNGN